MEIISFFIVGGFSSGKTAFIEVHAEPRVAMFYEEVPNDPDFVSRGQLLIDEDLILFTLGGYPSILAQYKQEYPDSKFDGHILLLDSATQHVTDWQSARYTLRFLQEDFPTVPLIVAAHKQDLPTAKSPATVRELLQIPPTIPVMPSSIHQPHTIQAILLALLRRCPNEPKFQTALQIMEEVWQNS